MYLFLLCINVKHRGGENCSQGHGGSFMVFSYAIRL